MLEVENPVGVCLTFAVDCLKVQSTMNDRVRRTQIRWISRWWSLEPFSCFRIYPSIVPADLLTSNLSRPFYFIRFFGWGLENILAEWQFQGTGCWSDPGEEGKRRFRSLLWPRTRVPWQQNRVVSRVSESAEWINLCYADMCPASVRMVVSHYFVRYWP